MVLLLLVLVLCSLAWIYYKHFYLYNVYLKKFTCPPEVPILGHTLDFFSGKGKLDVLMHYINNYGDVVRLKTGPQRQLLLTSNYNFFQFILTNNKILKKSMDYDFFRSWLGDGLLTSTGDKWKKNRKIITPTFHYKILDDFIEVFERNAKTLTKKFEEHLDSDSVDIFDITNLCTLDVICESAMGTFIDAQNNVQSEYVQSVKNMLDIIIGRVFSPIKMISWLYCFTDDYKKEKRATKVIHSYTWDVINRRQQALKQEKTETCDNHRRKALLDLLLEKHQKGEQLSLDEIREQVDTFIFAGHDTTGTAVCFTLFCLATHPEEQAKVFKEQREILGENFDRPLTIEDYKKMKYLEMAIKESLRLYPPAPFYSRDLEEDVEYDGTILPSGLTICLFVFALHRNPNYYSDPEKFIPSRFEKVDGKMPFAYLPFSAGPRNCIGQKFAMLELKSIVSKVIRTFELLPSNPEHHLKLESQTILLSTNGVRMTFKKRNNL